MQTELKSYRAEARDKAIAIMEDSGGFLLFNEQRTGKTDISLGIVDHFKKEITTLLVVCPKGARKVWEEAIQRETDVGWPDEIIITNYEQIRCNHLSWYKWADKRKELGLCIIADEIHRIKDRGSSTSMRLRTLARRAMYKVGLTGTPIEQNLHDAWPLFNFINPEIFGPYDNELGPDKKTVVRLGFEGRYLVKGGYQNKQVVGYRNRKKFQKILDQYSYRITLDEAKRTDGKLPPITQYTKAYCELTGQAARMYKEAHEEMLVTVNERRVKFKNILAACAKLQQITGGFFRETVYEERKVKNRKTKKLEVRNFPVHTDHAIGTEKIQLLHEKLRSLQSRTKFLIICRHVWEIETIHSFLFRLGYRMQIVRGGLPYSGKIDGDGVIMQIASACAVDMSAADTIFFYSSSYSSIQFEQARFRILAYAKDSPSRYVFLLAKGTIDEVIYDAISNKKRLVELIIDRYRRTKYRRKRGS